MKTRIYNKVFLLALLSGLILADKTEDNKEKVEKKADIDEEFEEVIDSQESKQPIGRPPPPVQKLQTAAGFNSPAVSLNYGGGNYQGGGNYGGDNYQGGGNYQGGNVQVQKEVYQPKPYRFGYEIKDKGGKTFRQEEDDGSGSKKGSYGYRDAYGLYRIVEYVADHNGFRAAIRTNEPGTVSSSPAYVNIVSENQPQIGQGGKQGRSAFAPTDVVYSAPRIPVGPPPVQTVKLLPQQQVQFLPPPPPQPIRFVHSPPPRQIRFEHAQPPQQFRIEHSQPPQQFRIEHSQPPQQFRIEHSQPPQQIRIEHSQPPQQFRIEHSQPPQQFRIEHSQPPQQFRIEHSQPPQQFRIEHSQPPQQIRFVQTAPQPLKAIPQQQINFIPPRHQVRFSHQPPQQLIFGPPRPQQFVARSPAQLLQQIPAPQPANIINSRPQIDFRRPISIRLRPGLFNGPPQIIKPLPSAPVQIGGFHNRPGLRLSGPPRVQLPRPVGHGHQAQPIRIQNGLIINEGPINGPIITRAPILNQGPVGGIHVGGGPVQGPIIHQVTPQQQQQQGFYGQNIPVRGDIASLKVTAGAPIVTGPGIGHVYVEQRQKVEGLTRNVFQGLTGGIRKGLSDGLIRGTSSIVGAPMRLYKGFKESVRNGLVQGLRGAHSGENNEGQQAVLAPKKQADQTIFVGPFPGRHEGKHISHIVMSKVHASSPQESPNSNEDRKISRIVVSKVPDTETEPETETEGEDEDDSDYRKPVEIPGRDPAYIGPGPAPKFDPSEIKKKLKDNKPRRQQLPDKKRRKPKPTTIRPIRTTIRRKTTTIRPKTTTIRRKTTTIAPKTTTISPNPENVTPPPSIDSSTRAYYPPPTRRPATIDIEFTIPFGK